MSRSAFASVLFSFIITLAGTCALAQGTAVRTGPAELVYECSYACGTYYLTTQRGFYRSPDAVTWTKIHAIDQNGGSLVTLPTGEVFVFNYDTYEISTNNGDTWSPGQQNGFSTRRAIADSAGTLFAGQNDPVYVSHDKGASWSKTNPGASQNFFDVSTLVIGPDGYLYAGNQGITGGYAYRSTDHGAHWKLLHAETMDDVTRLEVYPSGVIILGYADKTLRSNYDGVTWTQIAAQGGPGYPRSAVFLNDLQGYALAAGGKVVRTSDGGASWDSSKAYFDRDGFTALYTGPKNVLFAASAQGLYSLKENASVNTTHSATATLHVWPNPASDHVYLECKTDDRLSVSVYDAMGAHVLSADVDAHSPMRVSDLPAGLYHVISRGTGGTSAGAFTIVR